MLTTIPHVHAQPKRFLNSRAASRCTAIVGCSIFAASLINIRNNSTPDRQPRQVPQTPVTNALLIINVAFMVLQYITRDPLNGMMSPVTAAGMKVNTLILVSGQYYRLITAAFLHGNIWHLAANAYSLYQLGVGLENYVGHKRFLAIYLGSAIAGNVASLFFSSANALGASTAVFGLFGMWASLEWSKYKSNPDRRSLVTKNVLMTMLTPLMFSRVDHFGHLGGFLGGILFQKLLGPNYTYNRSSNGKELLVIDDPPIKVLASKPFTLRLK